MSQIADRLSDLGIVLSPAPKPVASYVPAVRIGDIVIVSGQIPLRDGQLMAVGPVPSTVSLEEAQDAARCCVLNGLAVIQDAVDSGLDAVERIVRLGVYVCSDSGFTDQPKVANGASDLLLDIFGDRGRHARAAVGSIALPLGATVEVEMMVQIRS